MYNTLFKDKLNNLSEVITPVSLVFLQKIGEYKGKQILYSNQQEEYLTQLQLEAIINNAIYSNAIDGINIEFERFNKLFKEQIEPEIDRESEIMRYVKVLNIINGHNKAFNLNPELILDFHKNIFRYKPNYGGKWKPLDNIIEHYDNNGNSEIVFVPVAAKLTPHCISELCLSYESLINDNNLVDLIIIAAFILDFSCIHPFTTGNGRIIRLLTILLLLQRDYQVAKYMSLDEIIYNNRSKYLYELNKSSQNWHEAQHNLSGWVEFFLWVIYSAYYQLDSKIFVIKNKKGAKSLQIKMIIDQLPVEFKVSDIVKKSTGIARPTINKVLQELKDLNLIKPASIGRDAVWIKQY